METATPRKTNLTANVGSFLPVMYLYCQYGESDGATCICYLATSCLPGTSLALSFAWLLCRARGIERRAIEGEGRWWGLGLAGPAPQRAIVSAARCAKNKIETDELTIRSMARGRSVQTARPSVNERAVQDWNRL